MTLSPASTPDRKRITLILNQLLPCRLRFLMQKLGPLFITVVDVGKGMRRKISSKNILIEVNLATSGDGEMPELKTLD